MSGLLRLLRYGNWSGPGWSNGGNYGGRVLSDAELRTPGIDAYDNYVAKVHDLNEIFASQNLRVALAQASGVHSNLLLKRDDGDYVVPLVFVPVPGLSGTPRFIDIGRYLDSVAANEREATAEAIYTYFEHVMRSNMQFAIDYLWNEPYLFNPNAVAMIAQLLIGPHFFLSEAKWIEDQLLFLRQKSLISEAHLWRVSDLLRAQFVSPTFGNQPSQYIPPVSRAYVRNVEVEMLLVADRSTLLRRAIDLRNVKNRID